MEMRSNKNIRIGDVLQELGYINEDQINQAVAYQKENKGVRLGAEFDCTWLYHRETDVRGAWKASEL